MQLRHMGYALSSLAAVSCGESGDPTEGKSPEQMRREIEAVATPKPLAKDEPLPFRLRPLKVGEVWDHLRDRPACILLYRDRIVFVAAGVEGIARIDGRLTRLAASGPVSGSGGFFRAEGATLSIGRIGQYAGRAAAYVPTWPVDVAVGGAPRSSRRGSRGAGSAAIASRPRRCVRSRGTGSVQPGRRKQALLAPISRWPAGNRLDEGWTGRRISHASGR